jgi:hypothetical protein
VGGGGSGDRGMERSSGVGKVVRWGGSEVGRVSDDEGAALSHRRSPPSALSGSSRPRGETNRVVVEGGAEGNVRGEGEESDEQVWAMTWP